MDNKETETTDNTDDDDGQYETITPEEDRKTRQEIADGFFELEKTIEVQTGKILELLKSSRKEKHGRYRYICMDELQEGNFKQILRDINALIARAQTKLDTLVQLEKSTPKFDNYLNLFFLFYETCITKHSESRFYQFHVERHGMYTYPLKSSTVGLDKLATLLARVRGTLKESGEFVLMERTASGKASQQQDSYSQYGGYYNWQNRYHNDDRNRMSSFPADRPQRVRDIGDLLDGVGK